MLASKVTFKVLNYAGLSVFGITLGLQSNLVMPAGREPPFHRAGGDAVDFDEAATADTTHGGGHVVSNPCARSQVSSKPGH